MHRIWIGLQPNLVLGVFMGALALVVIWLHLWAAPVIGYTGNTHSPQHAVGAPAAAPTR